MICASFPNGEFLESGACSPWIAAQLLEKKNMSLELVELVSSELNWLMFVAGYTNQFLLGNLQKDAGKCLLDGKKMRCSTYFTGFHRSPLAASWFITPSKYT